MSTNNSTEGGEMTTIAQEASRVRAARIGKMSHITRRMNIVRNLMVDAEALKEVKINMSKFNEFLMEFKSLHRSYSEGLEPDERRADDQTWYQPKIALIDAFEAEVSRWISDLENPSTHTCAPPPDDIDIFKDSDLITGNFKDNLEEADSLYRHELTGHPGIVSTREASVKSYSSGQSSNNSSSSLRIRAEAEKVALTARAARLQEKYNIEEQELMCRKKREALELKTEIEAANAKINYLREVEGLEVHGADQRAAVTGVAFDPSRCGSPVGSPVVRPKEGVQMQFPTTLFNASIPQAVPASFQPQQAPTQPQQVPVVPLQAPCQPAGLYPQQAPVHQAVPASFQFQTQQATPSSTQNNQLIKILEAQNELTKILVKQQLLSTLPQGSVPFFDGKILEYKSFIHSFEHMVESKTDNDRDRLQFLIQYTKGHAQKLIKSCEYMSPDRGYQKAKRLLKENFGHDFKIACAYLDKVQTWPQIKAEDSKSLQEYAMFLRSCCNAMEETEYMDELDTVANMRNIAFKLPFKLKEKWRNKAYEQQEEHNHRVRVLDLVSFIEKQARVAAHPVFGELRVQEQSAIGKANARPSVNPQHSKSAGSSFATSITISPMESKPESDSEPICLICKNKHPLELCRWFIKKKHRDKLSFLKSQGMCFACLLIGHMSSVCPSRQTCRLCKKSHPSVLHYDRKDKVSKEVEKPSREVSSAGAELCGHIGAGDQESVLSIVPVKVKAGKGSQVLSVYALLDPGSSASFCSEQLMSQLNIKGVKTHILLRTMNQKRSVPTHMVAGLEVSALDSNHFLPLPVVFTQKEMPVTTSSIPKQEDIAPWPYLGNIILPSISSKVELLIGTNAPRLLEPWEVINSHGGGPHAVRTLLGWVVNGPFRGQKRQAVSATVNSISVANLEELLISQYNLEFSEVMSEEKTKLSVEDKQFLEIANEAVLQDGHYSLKLPFRKPTVNLPNNRPSAEQCLQSLKRKMERNQQLKQECVASLNDILESHYAEKVPEQELSQTQVWYIPHHRVYHPKKKKLRVVFDCAATYKGVSLKTKLSQWRYVGSKDNPADDASRGLSTSRLMQQRRWIHAPDFLWKAEESWPAREALGSKSVLPDDPEVRKNTTIFTTVVNTETPTSQLLSSFSNSKRLLRAVAWYLKMKNTLSLLAKRKKELLSGQTATRSHSYNVNKELKTFRSTLGGQRLTVEDVSQAEKSVIIHVQRQSFPVEMATLKTASSSVRKSSNISRLDPMLDEGMLRVGGRLHRSAMPEEAKHPCILPKDAHISTLILRHIHEHTGHSGRNHMLSELRKKYWVVKGNSAARKVISKCVVCRRVRGKTGEQKMASLPQERILPDLPPFTNVGLDYFGPITVKRGRSLVKRYGALFTCMSSRAVHLEVAYTLDTDSCIHAIRRFVCRRGQVKHIRSDNGTNLVGAQAELKKALSSLDDRKIQGSLLSEGIQWTFNPPAASHHGGVWERLIRSVRQVLNSTLHQQIIDDEGLHTIFCEAEAILNSRPLSTVSPDPQDLEPLTPNHILLLKTQPIIPPGTFEKRDLYARRRWKQERQKWTQVRNNLQPGDVVLVVDPTAPRGSWPLGRILETRPDGGGLVRSVKLQTKTSVIERPITKLCRVLEAEG
ncbi:uncharacterized protein LOC133633659 [Entelurus aequoreus]|uniref:uncharacterized protein LOC133633659 n=2 Tax=Entelurus aequoreus TaxID=161455 RepID=UPI002B1D9EC4|nr:uncharacterized protein LOC133633659 [Entelurus aequoreus]